MSRFAVVVMLPEREDDPARVDFVSREFDTWAELADAMTELDAGMPDWRLVTLCHVEDLPMLMEADGVDFRELGADESGGS